MMHKNMFGTNVWLRPRRIQKKIGKKQTIPYSRTPRVIKATNVRLLCEKLQIFLCAQKQKVEKKSEVVSVSSCILVYIKYWHDGEHMKKFQQIWLIKN